MNRVTQLFRIGITVLAIIGMTNALAADFTPPQTEFGVPDLQGVWNFKTRTSLERPDAYDGALEIDEATMLEKMVSTPDYLVALEASGAEAPGPQNVGGYNGWWISPGDALAFMNDKFRTSLIVDPVDGQIPWQEEADAIRRAQRYTLPMGLAESDGPEGRTLSDRCLVSFASTAPFMSSLYNNHMQIVQSPTHVVLLAEMVHNARVVRIDQDFRELPYEQWLGDSIGYYDGDALVVETRNFHPWQVGKERLTSTNMHLTERFTRVADDKLHYSFTIEDPELYSRPWTGEMPMYTGENLYEYACHEGNYALPAILAGARRVEADARAEQQ
jgi:hypothetical protein